MSSTQNVASPRAPKGRNHHSGSGSQPLPPNNKNNGPKGQRRQKGNRAKNGDPQLSAQDSATDTAVLSGEDVAIPAGLRHPKKHTNSQPTGERIFSPTSVDISSLTDTEVGPAHTTSTPAKAQAAYAGPTFHASPAPSALPIPKFLSKSVPAKTRVGPPTPPPDEEGSDSASPTPSPSRAPVLASSRHQDSPLDMLFKADREERARNSPALPLLSSPSQPPGNCRPHHAKHESYGSLNTPFPFELDGENKASHTSPPVPPPAVHRAVTAPSNIPQAQASPRPNDKADAVQDLLNRLSMSQKSLADSTPPRTIDHVPSDPSLRTHASPFNDGTSPFRSTSGPTTPAPAPAPQANPDFFYGNRNLSPLFKAASKKPDDSNRNSGLRTEITADSPIMPQGAFPLMPPLNFDTNNGMQSRVMMGNALNGAASPRRGSAPHVQPTQPYRGSPHQHHRRGSGRRNYQPRPDSYPHANANKPANEAPAVLPAPSPKPNNMMAFVPSSVRAKPKPQAMTPPKMTTPPPDNLTLEQDLKRMLNLGTTSNITKLIGKSGPYKNPSDGTLTHDQQIAVGAFSAFDFDFDFDFDAGIEPSSSAKKPALTTFFKKPLKPAKTPKAPKTPTGPPPPPPPQIDVRVHEEQPPPACQGLDHYRPLPPTDHQGEPPELRRYYRPVIPVDCEERPPLVDGHYRPQTPADYDPYRYQTAPPPPGDATDMHLDQSESGDPHQYRKTRREYRAFQKTVYGPYKKNQVEVVETVSVMSAPGTSDGDGDSLLDLYGEDDVDVNEFSFVGVVSETEVKLVRPAAEPTITPPWVLALPAVSNGARVKRGERNGGDEGDGGDGGKHRLGRRLRMKKSFGELKARGERYFKSSSAVPDHGEEPALPGWTKSR
ncbi:hypothetical protein CC80DRAFT_592551 [Byssothecium circinans]|uniref:Uncharacterized protein n=1 Tax=Byssothecium circinans TaxID=147558 RepID=A0A6A5TXU0_9PLEO|nr:hypothetical protein CC80DRAFT_592551 [Byssothecium circinans]